MFDYPREVKEQYKDGLRDGLSSKKPLRSPYEPQPGVTPTEVRVSHKEKEKK